MDSGLLIDLSREAVWVLIKISMPILCIALLVGLVISLIQALTQIQEATLSFVPKVLVVFISLIFLMPSMIHQLQTLFDHIIERIIIP